MLKKDYMQSDQDQPEIEQSDLRKKSANPTLVDHLFDGLLWVYDRFMNFVRLNDDDPILWAAFKIFVRAVGIIIAVILSPFIIFGFIITIMVVS